MPRSGKETVQFKTVVTAGTLKTLSYTIKADATVERIFGKFYPGQEGVLHVHPYLRLNGDRHEELVTYPTGTDQFLSGDDQIYDFAIDFPVNTGDQIMVDADNTLGTYDYTLDITFEVDYMAGKDRA